MHIAEHPATGGHLLVGRDARTYQPAFVRLDAAGQTVSSLVLDPGNVSIGITDLTRLAGGGYALSGYGSDITSRGLTMLLDSSGQPLLSSLYLSGQLSEWLAMSATADGGVVVVGNGYDNNFVSYGIVAKLDAQMDTVWTRVLPRGSGSLTLKRVAVLPSGNLILVGERADIGNTNYRLAVTKLTAAGDLVWSNQYTIGGGWWQYIRDLQYDGQNRLFMTSLIRQSGAIGSLFSRTVLDTAGNFIRMDSLSGGSDPELRGVGLGQGGEFLLAGTLFDGNSNQVGFNLAISAADSLLWANSFEINGAGILFQVLPASNGGYWWTATDFAQSYLLHSDAQGAVADSCGTSPLAIQVGPLSCTTTVSTQGLLAGLDVSTFIPSTSPLTVFNQLGCLLTGLPNPALDQRPLVYPQPMHTSARIRLQEGGLDGLQLLLHDLGGKTIFPPVTATSEGLEFQRGGLPAGLYSYQVLHAGQRIASGKLLVAD
jgi:hypothetical protein